MLIINCTFEEVQYGILLSHNDRLTRLLFLFFFFFLISSSQNYSRRDDRKRKRKAQFKQGKRADTM